jgi:hypothetical protein
MKVYADTNVYSFIRVCDEAERVRAYLRQKAIQLIATDSNLFEMFAIARPSIQRAEIETLFSVASRVRREPEAWLHAEELRREIAAKRPAWLRKLSFTRRARAFLNSHALRWEQARDGILPSQEALATFRRAFESGVAISREAQKQHREWRFNGVAKGLSRSAWQFRNSCRS